MACHYMDLPHWALDLRHPPTVEAEGPPVHPESCPVWLIVRFQYPARGKMPPVLLTWYNGKRRPHYFQEGKLPKWGDGVLFVGEKGMLLADYDRHVLLPEKDFADYKRPETLHPRVDRPSPRNGRACKRYGREKRPANFDYSGRSGSEPCCWKRGLSQRARKSEWTPSVRRSPTPTMPTVRRPPRQQGWELR
jgi:hypothetical protein